MQQRNYLFNKPATQFITKQVFEAPDKKDARQVIIVNKKEKKNSSNGYATADWYNINSKYVPKRNAHRIYRAIILAGEIFGLIDINDSVKYRVCAEEVSPTLLSKGVKNPIEYFSFIGLYRTTNARILEGMGRQYLIKIFLAENDNKFDNCCVNRETNYFYAIDHGQCFWPLTMNFYQRISFSYFSSLLTTKDYDNFPNLKSYLSKNMIGCEFEEIYPRKYFLTAVSKNKLFLNEKHFTALKLLITDQLQQRLAAIHIRDSVDNLFLKNFLDNRSSELNKVCQKSKAFKNYLRENKKDLLHVLLFEVNEFFNKNRHYEQLGVNRVESLLYLVERYDVILQDMKIRKLVRSNLDKIELNSYLKMIIAGNPDVIHKVKTFYASQKMTSFVNLAERKLLDTQSLLKAPAFFSLKQNNLSDRYKGAEKEIDAVLLTEGYHSMKTRKSCVIL